MNRTDESAVKIESRAIRKYLSDSKFDLDDIDMGLKMLTGRLEIKKANILALSILKQALDMGLTGARLAKFINLLLNVKIKSGGIPI